MNEHLILWLPGTMIDDFFVFGFLGGAISYLYYRLVTKPEADEHLGFWTGLYGTILSGSVGGLLAIVFDRSIGLAIIVGLLHQILYLSFIKSAKGGKFFDVLREVLIRYLTGGTKP